MKLLEIEKKLNCNIVKTCYDLDVVNRLVKECPEKLVKISEKIVDDQIDRPIRGVPHLCVVRSPGCGNLDGYHRLLKFGNSGLAFPGNCIVDQGDPMLLHRTCQLLHSRQRLVNQQGDRLFIGVITYRSLRIRSAHFHIVNHAYQLTAKPQDKLIGQSLSICSNVFLRLI